VFAIELIKVQIVDEIVEGGLEFVVFYYFDLIDFVAL